MAFKNHGPGCCCGGGVTCDGCTTDPNAGAFDVVISGMVNGTCADCNTLDGTYSLTLNGTCRWDYNLPVAICAGTLVEINSIRFTIANSGGNLLLTVTTRGPAGSGGLAVHTWFISLSGLSHDCQAFSSQSLNYSPVGAVDSRCDGTSSTCTVTYVP